MPDPHYLSRIESALGLWRLPMDSPAGPIELVATATKMACVILGQIPPRIRSLLDAIPQAENYPLAATREFLSGYFQGPHFPRDFSIEYQNHHSISLINPRPGITSIDLDLCGYTVKQIAVYCSLLETKIGDTLSYESLALRAGVPRGARFVGTAMAKNSFPILIPCHRVIRADGSAGRYSGGDGIKRFLLEHEYAMIQNGRTVS